MSEAQDIITEATTDVVTDTVVEEGAAPAQRKGWVRSIAEDRYHEVDDVDLTLQAYPDQFEEVKEKDVKKSKVGWADQKD